MILNPYKGIQNSLNDVFELRSSEVARESRTKSCLSERDARVSATTRGAPGWRLMTLLVLPALCLVFAAFSEDDLQLAQRV